MSGPFAPVDPALAAVLEACREELLTAARPAIDAGFQSLLEDGHSVPVVATALVSTCAQLLFEAIYANVQDIHRVTVAEDATARLLAHIRTVGSVDALAEIVPAGVTLQ